MMTITNAIEVTQSLNTTNTLCNLYKVTHQSENNFSQIKIPRKA